MKSNFTERLNLKMERKTIFFLGKLSLLTSDPLYQYALSNRE